MHCFNLPSPASSSSLSDAYTILSYTFYFYLFNLVCRVYTCGGELNMNMQWRCSKQLAHMQSTECDRCSNALFSFNCKRTKTFSSFHTLRGPSSPRCAQVPSVSNGLCEDARNAFTALEMEHTPSIGE